MPTKINIATHKKLIEEDLEWLLHQPRSLANDHIRDLLRLELTTCALFDTTKFHEYYDSGYR